MGPICQGTTLCNPRRWDFPALAPALWNLLLEEKLAAIPQDLGLPLSLGVREWEDLPKSPLLWLTLSFSVSVLFIDFNNEALHIY